MAYTREQIYAAMRRADQAGDAGAVRALSRQLRALDQPGKPDFDNISVQDARRALERGEASLRERASSMPTTRQRQARQAFENDPRIKALRDRADDFSLRTFAGDLGSAAANTLAGAAEGTIAPIIDTPIDLSVGVQRLTNVGLEKAGGGLLRAVGLEGAANWWERGAQANDRALDQQMDPAANLIEQVVPTPQDTAGRVARIGSGLIAGMMLPMPKAKAPIRAPNPAPASAADDIVREGQRAGVRVMTSDVRPPKTFIGQKARAIGERIPFAGTGGPRAAQQAERVEAVRTLVKDFGGDDVAQLFDDAPSALDDVARSLTAQRGRELTRLTNAKKGVIARYSSAGQVPVTNTLQAGPLRRLLALLQRGRRTNAKKGVIARYSSAGQVPVTNTLQAIDNQIAELTRRGSRPALAVVDDLKALRASVQGKTLDQLEAIRADELSNAFKGGDTLADVRAVGEKAVRAIYDPLRRDMGDFITAAGGSADAKVWREANERLAAMAGELDSTTFKNVLKNSEVTPEAVGRMLFSRNRSDVARLYANLDEAGKGRAQAAVLQRAFDKALSADQGLSVERFVNNLSQLGDSVGVVFQGDDLARVEGLTKVLNATRQAATAKAMPATGVQNAPVVEGFTLGSLFGWGAIPVAGAGGLLARAYESAPVRNLLLKLGRAKAGSAVERRLMQQVSRLITATAVSQRERLTNAANDEIPAVLAAQDQENDGNE